MQTGDSYIVSDERLAELLRLTSEGDTPLNNRDESDISHALAELQSLRARGATPLRERCPVCDGGRANFGTCVCKPARAALAKAPPGREAMRASFAAVHASIRREELERMLRDLAVVAWDCGMHAEPYQDSMNERITAILNAVCGRPGA